MPYRTEDQLTPFRSYEDAPQEYNSGTPNSGTLPYALMAAAGPMGWWAAPFFAAGDSYTREQQAKNRAAQRGKEGALERNDPRVRAQMQKNATAQMWQKYLAQLNKPWDPNDPYYQQAMALALNSAQQRNAGSGIQGGLAAGNVADAMAKRQVELSGQRQQQYGQALNAFGQWEQNQQGLDMKALQYNNELAQQRAMQEYQRNAGPVQGILSLLGGAAGAIPGIATGNMQMIAPGMQAGMGLGSAAGQMMTGYPQYQYNPYTPRSYGGG